MEIDYLSNLSITQDSLHARLVEAYSISDDKITVVLYSQMHSDVWIGSMVPYKFGYKVLVAPALL